MFFIRIFLFLFAVSGFVLFLYLWNLFVKKNKKFKVVLMTSFILLLQFLCHSYVNRMYSYVFVNHLCVLLCHSYVTRIDYCVIRISIVFTSMSSVCHSYVLVCHSYVLECHPYVTLMYLSVVRMSLVYTRMLSVCHSYILVCHPYVARMWFYHEPF